MSDDRPLSRRRFILVSSVAVAASGGLLAGRAGRFQPRRALSLEERRLVEALAYQVIPRDDTLGGRDAGVAEFIDRQRGGAYRRFLPAYRDGLAKIDLTSRRVERQPFAKLPFARQTALLEALDADRVPDGIWKPDEAGQFFRLVCDHCMQGFYGSPRHGGNLNYVSWRMIGLDYPQIVGRVVSRP
jgi:gluconate 2-dehydrogenase gamma chain